MSAQTRESDRRRAELAKIHVARKRLGLDEPTYRAIIARLCGGKLSAADLNQGERSALLDYFKSSGFLEGGSYTKKLSDFDDREPQAKLIRALWADLEAFGVLHDASEKALMKFVRRVGKVDRIEWLTPVQANACIEGLKAMKSRAGFKQKSTGSRS
jgi:phage gp16-like protein